MPGIAGILSIRRTDTGEYRRRTNEKQVRRGGSGSAAVRRSIAAVQSLASAGEEAVLKNAISSVLRHVKVRRAVEVNQRE